MCVCVCVCVCVCIYIYIYIYIYIWSLTLCNSLQSPINSSHLGQNIFHSTTVPNTRRLRSSLNARDHTKRDAKLNSFSYFNRYVLRGPTGREEILGWAAGIQSLSNVLVIPQKPSSTHNQLRRPVNLLLKQQGSLSFSFSLPSSFTTISLSPTMQCRLYEKWRTVSAWKGSGHGLVVEPTWQLPSESEENHKNLLVQPVSRSRFKDGTYWTQSDRDTATLAYYLSHISLLL